MLKENFPELRDWKVEILGTDLAADVVARARTGRYQRLEVNRGLPERSLLKHMRRVGEEWEMVPEIKRLCRFYQQNLCRGLLLFEPYDGILLRNVMIYFPAEMRRELLLSMHRILAPDGFLILGASEQPGLPEYFEPILAWGACYYKPVVNAQKE
jgi:chemotaxis protein methyltransferase CheR